MQITSRAEVEQAFKKLVLKCNCPSCGLQFTEYAYYWGDAWYEGRRDLLQEMGTTERDGPFKVKCEACGSKALIDYFAGTATLRAD